MKNLCRQLKAYPIVVLFLAFLMGFAILDELWPKRGYSEMENRDLAQRPAFSIAGVMSKDPNKTWMAQYNEYTKDQVAFRDGWINVKSRTENVLLKTENNGVWYGDDHYLFAKALEVGPYYQRNLGALQKFAERHPGQADVMIVPSASLVLEEKLPWRAPIMDEDAYLDEVGAKLGGLANVYDMRGVLAAHKDEYIFYRTDHHWTTDGAFYAYEAYAQANGLPVFDRAAAQARTAEGFYGTNYSKARNHDAVADTITWYDLPNQLTLFKTQKDGTKAQEAGPLMDTAALETRDKYRAFLRGNNGYSEIEGSGEGSILVVKDSYANCFIPFLTADYAKIGVVDFRDNLDKLDAIMAQGGYDKVLFLYSLDGFSTDTYLAARIATP